MIVHYYKQFYTGPNAVGPQQPRALAQTLAEHGHHVHVICGDHNAYDERDEPPECLHSGHSGSVTVHRLSAPRGMRASLLARLKTYGVFAAKAVVKGMLLERPDVVIGSIQPLFSGLSALAVGRRHGVPFVLEVRDIWPDALEAKGAVTGWKLRPLYEMADLLYRQACRIVSLTPGIKKELIKKGLDGQRIDIFPNGFDPELFDRHTESRSNVRKRLGWGDQFVALYVGTHTEVTAIDVIVRAAASLRDHDNIRFDLFGQGQTKSRAIALARQLGLDNVFFHDPVPKAQVPALIEASDVGLMTLFDSPLVHIYFENKLMDYMGAGKPIVAAMAGEQATLIRRYETGRVATTFDHKGLAELVADAAADYSPYAAMGKRGQELVRSHFVMSDILERYVERIERVAVDPASPDASWEPLGGAL